MFCKQPGSRVQAWTVAIKSEGKWEISRRKLEKMALSKIKRQYVFKMLLHLNKGNTIALLIIQLKCPLFLISAFRVVVDVAVMPAAGYYSRHSSTSRSSRSSRSGEFHRKIDSIFE